MPIRSDGYVEYSRRSIPEAEIVKFHDYYYENSETFEESAGIWLNKPVLDFSENEFYQIHEYFLLQNIKSLDIANNLYIKSFNVFMHYHDKFFLNHFSGKIEFNLKNKATIKFYGYTEILEMAPPGESWIHFSAAQRTWFSYQKPKRELEAEKLSLRSFVQLLKDKFNKTELL